MSAPLKGLKVVDIGWLMVGPVSARYLTELGADTIKVETGKRMDPLRGTLPFKDGQPGLGRSVSYHSLNANKRSLAIDVKSPEGLDLVRRIVAKADVFVESFTPGQIDQMGLSYAELSANNPRLIMISTGVLGRKGTIGIGMSGTGMTGSAYAGASNLIGWPDRAPEGPYGPWTDAIAPRFVASAALAALHYRKRTGKGQYIDVAQAEAGLQVLAPAFYDYAVNGVVAQAQGTLYSPYKVPCSTYPCVGEDRWMVIDADTPEAWDALCTVIPTLSDPSFSTLVGRLRARDEVDARIADWTRTQDAVEAEVMLQKLGVPAHVVSNGSDLASDTDLESVGYYKTVVDPIIGEMSYPGPQYTLERTPHVPRSFGPAIGDCSAEILTAELGLSAEEIERLKQDGILA